MKIPGRLATLALLAAMLAGCASAPQPDRLSAQVADSRGTDAASLRDGVHVMRLYLRSHDEDYHARLIMALMLTRLGELDDADEAFEIIVNQAPSDSPEVREARARLREHQVKRFQDGLPVTMPVWKGYRLTGAGAMCVTTDLRFPANRDNQFCSDPAPARPLVYLACGNTQFGSAGRTVQLIAAAGKRSCDDLGFRGEPVTPAEIEEALTLLGDQVSPEFATRFRSPR